MLPIFKEYIQFLKNSGVDIPIQEGYYWLDRQIIKGYDVEGNLHKIYRIKIDDNLDITYTKYKNKKLQLENWQNTVQRKLKKLSQLEENSDKLIQKSFKKYSQHEPIVLYSGGKDSIVINYLVQKNKECRIIFNNTSLDCADTYKYVKQSNNVEILNPKEGFYQWVKRYGNIPGRINRNCCGIFKEGETLKYLDKNKKYLLFMGMRNEESNTRSSYQDEEYMSRWDNRDWRGILPIRKWTEEDVWLYILWKGLDFNIKYRKGYSRVGCAIACPFYAKSTWVLDKYWYPTMYKRWHDILEKDFIENAKWTRLNCTLKEYHTCWNGGLLRPEPTEKVIQELADHKGIDFEVAKKYFNRNCKICGKKVNKNDEIAMNLKLLGRGVNSYFCKKHLMEYLNINKEQWKMYVEDFKKSGCELF